MAMSFFLGVQIVALLSNSYPFGNAFEGEAIMINMSLADLWIHPLAKTKETYDTWSSPHTNFSTPHTSDLHKNTVNWTTTNPPVEVDSSLSHYL